LSVQDTIISKPNSFPAATDWYPDSLSTFNETLHQAQTVTDSIQGTFFQPIVIGSTPIEITPLLRVSLPHEWMTNMLLLLMAFVVVLWFVMPKRLSFFQQVKQSFKSQDDIASQKPSFLFSFFFYLNYLTVVILSIFLAIETFAKPQSIAGSYAYFIVLTLFAFVAYSMYKLVFIVLSGFLFRTRELAGQQIQFYINIDNLTGFLLLPVLLLVLSSQLNYYFYFILFIILIANAIKWFQTFVIGKSNSTFTLYHLIIYLCTLEIIPLLLLIRLVENLSF